MHFYTLLLFLSQSSFTRQGFYWFKSKYKRDSLLSWLSKYIEIKVKTMVNII